MNKTPSIFQYSDPSSWLNDVYLSKKERNPGYSLRAFAKTLGLTHTVLTRFIQKKSELSPESILKIADSLDLNTLEKSYFEELCSVKQNEGYLDQLRVQSNTQIISAEQFGNSLNLKTFALLQLIELEPSFSIKSAALRLSTTPNEIEEILNELLKYQFVVKNGAQYIRTLKRVVFETEDDKKTLISFYKNTLHEAAKSLDNHAPSERAIGSETLSFDPSDLPKVSKIIDECLNRIVALSKKSKNQSEVYHCNMTMFRVTEGDHS